MRTLLYLLLLAPGFALAQEPPMVVLSDVERANAIIAESLLDSNPDTRRHAVQALGLIGPRKPYVGQLVAMLEDKDVEVRVATITTLVDLGGKESIAALKRALYDEIPEVSFAAAKALWSLNEPAGRDMLVSVLSGESKTSSGFFITKKREAVRLFHTPRAMAMFVLRRGVGMAHIPGLGTGVSSLEGIITGTDVSGRAVVALMLGDDDDPAVVAALRNALTDTEWSVRAAAAHALALRNDPALAIDLAPLLVDKKEAVRVRAAAAWLRLELIRTEPKPALPVAPRKHARKRLPAQEGH